MFQDYVEHTPPPTATSQAPQAHTGAGGRTMATHIADLAKALAILRIARTRPARDGGRSLRRPRRTQRPPPPTLATETMGSLRGTRPTGYNSSEWIGGGTVSASTKNMRITPLHRPGPKGGGAGPTRRILARTHSPAGHLTPRLPHQAPFEERGERSHPRGLRESGIRTVATLGGGSIRYYPAPRCTPVQQRLSRTGGSSQHLSRARVRSRGGARGIRTESILPLRCGRRQRVWSGCRSKSPTT